MSERKVQLSNGEPRIYWEYGGGWQEKYNKRIFRGGNRKHQNTASEYLEEDIKTENKHHICIFPTHLLNVGFSLLQRVSCLYYLCYNCLVMQSRDCLYIQDGDLTEKILCSQSCCGRLRVQFILHSSWGALFCAVNHQHCYNWQIDSYYLLTWIICNIFVNYDARIWNNFISSKS